jgi:ABC-type polysaccharide/polyol phosphate export permease
MACQPGSFRRWSSAQEIMKQQMKQHTFLLRELVRRDFESRYVGSLLGFLWAFLVPLWQLMLYSFVFATVMKVTVIGERTENFAVFMFCGMLPWLALQEGVTRSATAITDNAQLVKKMNFPTEILIVSAVVGGLIHEGIAALVFAVVLVFVGEFSWSGLPALLWILPLQVTLTLALGFILCCVQTLFRDTLQFLQLAMTGWFFFTPIVYPLGLVPEKIRVVLAWNPLTVLVTAYRQALLAGEGGGVDMMPLLGISAMTILLFILALRAFQRLKPAFADLI